MTNRGKYRNTTKYTYSYHNNRHELYDKVSPRERQPVCALITFATVNIFFWNPRSKGAFHLSKGGHVPQVPLDPPMVPLVIIHSSIMLAHYTLYSITCIYYLRLTIIEIGPLDINMARFVSIECAVESLTHRPT